MSPALALADPLPPFPGSPCGARIRTNVERYEWSRRESTIRLFVFAFVDATGLGRFVELETCEARQGGVEALPDPATDVLGGGLSEAGKLVEMAVIQIVDDRLNRGLELGEVHHPSGAGLNGPGDVDDESVGVAVEAAALMTGRGVGEAVGGLETELAEDLHRASLEQVGLDWDEFAIDEAHLGLGGFDDGGVGLRGWLGVGPGFILPGGWFGLG